MITKLRAFIKLENAVNPMQTVAKINFEKESVTIEQGLVFKFNNVELMQSTGLKDKNGVEIYEGDIVKVGTLEGEPIGYVKWFTDLAEYQVTNHINPFGDGYLSFYHARQFEVIGNIYENPELLEEHNASK